jgi:hypothetical protein
MEIEVRLDGTEPPQARIPAKAFYRVMLDWKDDFSNSAGMPGNLGDNGFMPVRRIRIHATEGAGRVVTVVNWHQYLKSATLTPFRFYAADNVEKPAVRNAGLRMRETEGRRFVAGLSPPLQKSNLLSIN